MGERSAGGDAGHGGGKDREEEESKHPDLVRTPRVAHIGRRCPSCRLWLPSLRSVTMPCMAEVLLERDAQLEVLVGAVAEGGQGARIDGAGRRRGGHRQDEPRARTCRARGRRGAGPHGGVRRPRRVAHARAAARCGGGSDGPLAAALATESPVDGVFSALLEELAEQRPTVLVVEDIHWADDATLDVLGYAARRVETARRRAGPDRCATSSIRAIRCTGCSARSRAARCTGIELAPLSRRRGAGAGGRHRPRPGRRARAHARQPVLRHRDARRAARRGAGQRQGRGARAAARAGRRLPRGARAPVGGALARLARAGHARCSASS